MITTKDAFLHPLLYLGAKPDQFDEAPRPIRFTADARFPHPMAWVTEDEGNRLIRRAGGLYRWAYKQPAEWLEAQPVVEAEPVKRGRRPRSEVA